MPKWMEALLFGAHLIPTLVLLAFALNLYVLMFFWFLNRKHRHRRVDAVKREFDARFTVDDLPPVVTQIPVYNEYNVVERVMRAVAAMEYPQGRHSIQVLDDSNDESCALIDRVAAELRGQGHDIQVVRRPTREGYKAGALKYGMTQTTADFFAIFDADFIPPRDFLMQTMPAMVINNKTGLVQARWGHLNREHSPITHAEALGLDGHFTLDQGARSYSGLFMNFNGTAGVWRRQAIDAAGGWHADTLTEDLDLSYRAQLAGWKCEFLFDVVVPAELPENMNALKAQQFRWAKGSIQTAIKLLPTVFRSDFSLIAKIQAFFQMCGYLVHPLILWVVLLSFPYSIFVTHFRYPTSGVLPFLFLLGTLAPYLIYGIPQVLLYRRTWYKHILYLPMITIFGAGIAVSNTRAVLEAVMGKTSAFIRTPKSGDKPVKYKTRISKMTLLEVLAGIYCVGAILYYLEVDKLAAVSYMAICATGFILVAALSLWHVITTLREQWNDDQPEAT
jgi:cellulose synthase/poly-beta-1,6-N-acetylglucosamine synthase-like glycosyltransferase